MPKGLASIHTKHGLVCTHGLVLQNQHISQVGPCKLPLEEFPVKKALLTSNL